MNERIALNLPDGRILDVQVSGPENGIPFIWHHGTPGWSFQPAARQKALHKHGLRLVSYSRAGAIGSTRKPGRTVSDITSDVSAIADYLKADQILTGGGSGGGPHALATAAGLPDRVLAAIAICSVKPFVGESDFLDGMGQDNVDEWNLAMKGEDALMPYIQKHREAILAADAQGLIDDLASVLPEVDRAVVTSETGADLLTSLKGGVQDVYAWADDAFAFLKDWGFSLDSIAVPTYLWHGSADKMVPFHHGEWLASRIPGVVPHMLPGEGHWSISTGKFDQMVEEVLPHLPASVR